MRRAHLVVEKNVKGSSVVVVLDSKFKSSKARKKVKDVEDEERTIREIQDNEGIELPGS